MQVANNVSIPESIAELIDPKRTALLVYDMQAGIVFYAESADQVTRNVCTIIAATRSKGVPIFYTRHFSAPVKSAGLTQLRTAMRFQRASSIEALKPHLLQGSPEYQLSPNVKPSENDLVFDKSGMSSFVGTPLEFCLRDLGIVTVIIVGCIAEIGIEPTVLHAADLGFLTVTASDACGSLNEMAKQQVMARLGKIGTVATAEVIAECWERNGS